MKEELEVLYEVKRRRLEYFGPYYSQRKVSSSAAGDGREDRGQGQARSEENILAQELKGLVWH